MPAAARVNDLTSHATPLGPGPGSSNVFIGRLPAWRALPAGVGAGLETASQAMSGLMSAPTLTPIDATAQLAQAQAGLTQSAGAAAAQGNATAVGATSAAFATLTATNAALTATYTAAAAVPGGAPAAAVAYTEGIKAAAAAAASAAVSALAAMADMHNCPIPCPTPPHGPGVVTQGSATVFINRLPAARQSDNVYEACGGADAIALGCLNVFIGDKGGGGSTGGTSSATSAAPTSNGAEAPATVASDAARSEADVALGKAAATVASQNRAAAASGKALCEICHAGAEST